jgi:predicted dehydrogenase
MKNGKIGVGIIGVQPDRSWAAIAPIPALRALPEYEIVALSTTKKASAEEAAKRYGIPVAFDNHADLVAHPDVDVVAVTVKVPHHLELVTAALNAGKAVYCEWPLGNGLAEAERMAELAKQKKVRTAVGLQARSAPVFNYVRDLVKDGYVGEVLSVTLVGSGANWGPIMETPNIYTADKKNGATVLTIPFGHTVDALCYVLGEFRDVTAMTARRRTQTQVAETGAIVEMTAEDQVIVSGTLQSGAVVSAHYRGGLPRGTGLLLEINGTAGDLQLTGMFGHAQLVDLTLKGATGQEPALQPLEIPAKYRWVPEMPSVPLNVAQAYARFAADLRDGTHTCPTFDDAVQRHRLIQAIETSAATGKRVTL